MGPKGFSSIDCVQRRRRQLRLAQRAYRSRRQNTINILQKRVDVLESEVGGISRSFLDFSNLLLQTRVLKQHPQVARGLRNITQQCVELAQVVYDSETGRSSEGDVGVVMGNAASRDQDTGPEIRILNTKYFLNVLVANSKHFLLEITGFK